MDPESIYETCLPILQDASLEEEDKTDALETLVRKETSLTGKSLENTVLDVLWRFRNQATPSTSPTVRHTVVRRNSPAPWQASRSGTPVAGSPRSQTGSPAPQMSSLGIRPGLLRMKSSYTNQSPFTSPRPSPRPTYLAPYASPGPKLGFEFDQTTAVPSPNPYEDFDPLDWPGSDDGGSVASGFGGGVGDAGDFIPSQMMEMSPYDILRSVLRDEKTDQEIEQILEANGYDLSAAIMSLMDTQAGAHTNETSPELELQQQRTFLVGKNMAAPRPETPVGQAKTPVVCRYWLSTGQCLRADCRFSHDLSGVLCKYWLAGQCLAGDNCIFSHDPSAMMGSMSISDSFGSNGSPPTDIAPAYQIQDHTSFPSLLSNSGISQSPGLESSLKNLYGSSSSLAPPPGLNGRGALAPEFIPSRPVSRPSSSKGPSNIPSNSSFDESDAFPTLGAAALRGSRKHHGKRGHGHSHKDNKEGPLSNSSLADIVRNTPASPVPAQSPRRSLRRPGSYSGTRENSAAAFAIPVPEHIPWLETGDSANKEYLKARAEAIKHGGARNKFLQSAAQAWNRSDVRAAKNLSLRGQNENDLMRNCHRAAAQALYNQRNSHFSNQSAASRNDEIYVDLHGLHPAEAVSYLAAALSERRAAAKLQRDEGEGSKKGVLYAIVGTGSHSKQGRDKVGKAVRAYLNECRYAFREFGAPGLGEVGTKGRVYTSGGGGAGAGERERGVAGGILGIKVDSAELGGVRSEKEMERIAVAAAEEDEDDGGGGRIVSQSQSRQQMAGGGGGGGKITLIKAEDVV